MNNDAASPEPKLNLLISYFYFRNVDVEEWLGQFKHPVRVFADSGAFSAHSQGKPLGVGEYVEWLHRWQHLFDHYAALDVKGNVDLGLKNLATMERAGLRPIPVFHGGEDLSVLDELISHGYPYIALGNIAKTIAGHSENTGAWLVECFQRGEGKCVFHGFGMTTPKYLWQLPFYSTDSSSWSAGFRFGAVGVYIRSEKRVVYLRNVKREPQHREKWEKYKMDVARHGQHIFDFMHHEIRSNVRYASVGAAAFQLMAQHIRQNKPAIPWPSQRDDLVDDSLPQPGPHLYLAAQGLPPNVAEGTRGRAWYELDALHFLDDNLEMYS